MVSLLLTEKPIPHARRFVAALGLLAMSACSSHGGAAPDGIPASARHMLSSFELQGTPFPSLLEAVQTLRGEWLHKRGPASFHNDRDIVVYLDGNRLGGPGALRTISTMVVVEARFMTPSEAQSHFGLNHPHGAILVITKI